MKKSIKKPAVSAKKAAAKKNSKATFKKKTTAKTKIPTKKSVKKTTKKTAETKKKPKRKPETLMCFLTTACVRYYDLADDGYELTTLRQYRDTYLASSLHGKNLIKAYYETSPKIVSQIEKDKNKKSIYAYIYSEVKLSCAAIEENKPIQAKRIYTRMVKRLQEKYLLS
ncbi:hypothetical protein CNR22_11730 [Sphingobacteriaceae bacterium]|nr:hypothetical protein CNR22_11730 [Sphingobacteriaceae bacterium]